MTDNSNVVVLDVVTRLDVPPERVLSAALANNLSAAVVIGYDSEGEYYFASSIADGAHVNWLLDRTKLKLLEAE